MTSWGICHVSIRAPFLNAFGSPKMDLTIEQGLNHLVNFIGDDIPEPENNRGRPLSPRTQLLVALRYYATGSFQIVHGDLQGVSQPSASRIVRSVLGALPSSEPSVFPVFGMLVVHKIGGNAHYRRYTTHWTLLYQGLTEDFTWTSTLLHTITMAA